MVSRTAKILAVSSSGGHWVQLMRMRPAWDGLDVAYLTTEASYRDQVDQYASDRGLARPRFHTCILATRWQKLRLLRQLLQILLVLLRERPDVIISTGAAAGFFALRLGKLIGARTIWVDSIANAGEMSLSGKKAKSCADAWLTQWPDLAGDDGPDHWGSVL